MKRFIIFVLIICALSTLLVGCSDTDDSPVKETESSKARVNQPSVVWTEPSSDIVPSEDETTADTATVSCDLLSVMEVIQQLFDLDQSREITDPERYYGIKSADVLQFCALKPLESSSYQEIILCEASSPEALSRVETMLHKRLDTLLNTAGSYDRGALNMIEACDVITYGNIAYLVISPVQDAIRELIDHMLTE